MQYKNTSSTTDVSSLSVTLSSSVTKGDILVAMINDEAGPTTNSFTISDSAVGGNNWVPAVEITDGIITVSEIFYGVAVSSLTDTVTAYFSSSTKYVSLSVWEISGYYPEAIVTSSGSGDGATFSVTSVGIASNSFVLAGVAADSAGTWSGTSGFTFSHGADYAFEYTTSPPSSTTASMSATGATHWTEVMIAFPNSYTAPTIGLVQSKKTFTGSTYVSSLSVTMNSNVTNNTLLVAMVNVEGGGNGVTISISDTQGSNWTLAKDITDTVITQSAVFDTSPPYIGLDTINVNFSNSVRYAVASVWEVVGYTTMNVTGSTGKGSSSCCAASPQISPSNDSFTLAGAAVDSAGAWTGTSGFNFTAGTDWAFEFDLLPPATTTASMSSSGSTYWTEVLISFQDPALTIAPYIGVSGFNTAGAEQDASEIDAITQMSGSSSNLGSTAIYAGIASHVPTYDYGNDFVYLLDTVYEPSGSVNIQSQIFFGCAGPQFNCGPVFWTGGVSCDPGLIKELGHCPQEVIEENSSQIKGVGSFNDQIQIRIRCIVTSNSSLCPDDITTGFKFFFQYQDLTTNSGWHNAMIETPPANYYTRSYLHVGWVNSRYGLYGIAYSFQVGAFFIGQVPANSNWNLAISNTEYIASGSSSYTMLNHATSLPWGVQIEGGGLTFPIFGLLSVYSTQWMELWSLSTSPAQNQLGWSTNGAQAEISGSGSGSSNTLNIKYYNSNPEDAQLGGVSLW